MIIKVLIFNDFHASIQHYFLLFISVKALNYICSDLYFIVSLQAFNGAFIIFITQK